MKVINLVSRMHLHLGHGSPSLVGGALPIALPRTSQTGDNSVSEIWTEKR
jgi:hypothetical protein